MEALRREAHDMLPVGTRKGDVIRFFAARNIPISFDKFGSPNEANGTIFISGSSECSSIACGTDSALIGLRVNLDDAGTVVSEPAIVSFYTDCL